MKKIKLNPIFKKKNVIAVLLHLKMQLKKKLKIRLFFKDPPKCLKKASVLIQILIIVHIIVRNAVVW